MKTLDWKKPPTVAFCCPLWLRDQHIIASIQRVKARIAPQYEKRSEPVAVVCFGPSLADTWEQVKEFRHVISCSGAHKFLIDRGIIPQVHVEVDPRPHKVTLLGQPHPDVEYLIASACSPAVFDHLEGFNVKLWHVFDSDAEGRRILPQGEWFLTGGCSVGLRAMVVARFLGFTDQHVFGMDGSSGRTGKHAAEHPNQPKEDFACDYGGVTYLTTPGFLAAAQQTWHELDQMPDVRATFYGDGLVQAMAKDYKPNPVPKGKAMIGFRKPELISAEYRELNSRLHKENLAYGVGGAKHAETVLKLAKSIESTSVLDYGCGKSLLSKAIPFPIWEYDPAIPGKDESPRPADLVIASDVLEHIEPEKLPFVLDDLRRCTKRIAYFVIHTGPAKKTLADGRNTHLIQQGLDWWHDTLSEFFEVGKIIERGPELHIVVSPKVLTLKHESVVAA